MSGALNVEPKQVGLKVSRQSARRILSRDYATGWQRGLVYVLAPFSSLLIGFVLTCDKFRASEYIP